MVSVEAVTGFGAAALHGIFLNGQGSGELLEHLLSRTSPQDCWHANILDEHSEVIDDVVCLRWTSSEEAFLLTTHGNRLILDRVLDRCVALGAHSCSEKKAIFGTETQGSVNRIRREALSELPNAASDEACAFLLTQSSGSGFAGEVALWQQEPPSVDRVEELLGHAEIGLQITDPPTVVLTGVTNAGKSTLFNRLIGEDRSIVTPIEGTTRDLVRAHAMINGWPLILVDGAGTRETDDPVESEGLRRLSEEISRANLVLELVLPGQAARGTGSSSESFIVHSRCDEWDADQFALTADSFRVSAVTGEGIPQLETAILDRLHGGQKFDPNQPCPFLAEHVIFLEQLRSCLIRKSGAAELISGFLEGAGECHR